MKKKGLTAKRLDFSTKDFGYVFNPRKPFTRSQLSKGDKSDKENKEVE